MSQQLTVAALQMATASDVNANTDKIHRAIDRAGDKDVRVLVTPECAVSGYLPDPVLDESTLKRARKEIVSHAADQNLWLALGCPTRRQSEWYNSALLYTPEGNIHARYDKTELMPGDHIVFAEGNDLPVFELDGWCVGLQICFDMRFPENWRILRMKGAEVILHLSSAAGSAAWKVPVLEGTVRCRAAENGNFVVSSNDARRPQMMVSAICDPRGKHLACAEENQEEFIMASLEREEVRNDYLRRRRTDLWNSAAHRQLLLNPSTDGSTHDSDT